MENLIGWVLIVLVPVAIIYTALKIRRRLEKIKQDRYEAEYRLAEERAKQARERERQRAKEREEWQARLDGAGVKAKTTYDFNSNTVRSAVTNKKTKTTTYVDTPVERNTTQPVNNWSTDLLTTMVIADMLTNHKDVSAGTVSWKDDTPTIKETYSKPSTDFGMDDSDSRKSASSSFSTSDSSSSWSDSSSSSSDSGPSSDW
jgi:hypothetical protein